MFDDSHLEEKFFFYIRNFSGKPVSPELFNENWEILKKLYAETGDLDFILEDLSVNLELLEATYHCEQLSVLTMLFRNIKADKSVKLMHAFLNAFGIKLDVIYMVKWDLLALQSKSLTLGVLNTDVLESEKLLLDLRYAEFLSDTNIYAQKKLTINYYSQWRLNYLQKLLQQDILFISKTFASRNNIAKQNIEWEISKLCNSTPTLYMEV